MLEKFSSVIGQNKNALKELTLAIWSHPEIAWQEKFAAAAAKDFLERSGFQVTVGCFGVETAFTCQYGNGDGPVFAVASEYDALPEIGHGCGHNLICIAGISAFLALADALKNTGVPGKVVLLGTPAEEGAGGKVRMLANGCLKGVDAVIMAHPSAKNYTDGGSTANKGLEVTFHGKAAHAAGCPEKGINALDAANLLFAAVSAYRQQMPPAALIHGFINNGGAAANIIPDLVKCRFYLRTFDEKIMPELERRFTNMVRGAELMTDCTADIAPFREAYRSRRPNTPMNELFARSMEKMEMPVIRVTAPGKGSSDFGDFSQTIPGIHPSFAISPAPTPDMVSHSTVFRDVCATDYAIDSALKAGAAMAQVGWDFITDEKFRNEVKEDFARRN